MAHGRFTRLAGAAGAALIIGALAALPAAAQELPPEITTDSSEWEAVPPSIGDALDGELDEVTGTAAGGFDGDDSLIVTLTLHNHTDAPVELVVPRAGLFATDDPTNQTAVATGVVGEDPEAVSLTVDPLITVEPGEQTIELQAFCGQEFDTGPDAITPMHWEDVGLDPLPRVAANIAAQQPTLDQGRDAVWWVTDQPVIPVPAHIEPLLEGVDTAAFAEAPVQVVPDEAYRPAWDRGEAFDPSAGFDPYRTSSSGSGGFPVLLILAGVGVLFVAMMVVFARWNASGPDPRTAPALVRKPGSGPPAGWHPDPHDPGGLRYWDGGRWTEHTRRR